MGYNRQGNNMKRIFSVLPFLCVLWNISAQDLPKPGGCFEHVIEVTSYSDWGPDYLTIINPMYCSDGTTLIPTTYMPTTNESAYFPGCGDIILELNGKSAKNMSPKQFYSLIDTATTFELKISNPDGEIFVQEYAVVQKNRKQVELYPGFRNFMQISPASLSTLGKRNAIENNPFQSISNENYDFLKAKTYDYIITGNDPLTDEKILDGIEKSHMVRDIQKPDILFTISKNADERVASTYIPPTSRTINTGSKTTARYNYFTKTYDYVTTQNNRTINEGGYTQTTKTADIFLEIVALDAKKINDKSISYAPIIWQMTASEHLLNATMKNLEKYLIYASWAYMPPLDRIARKEETLREVTGLVPDNENPALVAEVREGSRAEKAGFQKGDILLKYEYNTSTRGDRYIIYGHHIVTPSKTQTKSHTTYQIYGVSDERSSNTRKNSNNFRIVSHLNSKDELENNVKCFIKRNGKTMTLTLQPQKKTFTRFFWLSDEQLRKVRY